MEKCSSKRCALKSMNAAKRVDGIENRFISWVKASQQVFLVENGSSLPLTPLAETKERMLFYSHRN